MIFSPMEVSTLAIVSTPRVEIELTSVANENQNLWQQIKQSIEQQGAAESHLIVLGDKGSGKRTLLQAMNKHCIKSKNPLIEVDKMMSHYAGLDFAFLYAKDLNEKDAINTQVTSDENLATINTWIVQDLEKVELLT